MIRILIGTGSRKSGGKEKKVVAYNTDNDTRFRCRLADLQLADLLAWLGAQPGIIDPLAWLQKYNQKLIDTVTRNAIYGTCPYCQAPVKFVGQDGLVRWACGTDKYEGDSFAIRSTHCERGKRGKK